MPKKIKVVAAVFYKVNVFDSLIFHSTFESLENAQSCANRLVDAGFYAEIQYSKLLRRLDPTLTWVERTIQYAPKSKKDYTFKIPEAYDIIEPSSSIGEFYKQCRVDVLATGGSIYFNDKGKSSTRDGSYFVNEENLLTEHKIPKTTPFSFCDLIDALHRQRLYGNPFVTYAGQNVVQLAYFPDAKVDKQLAIQLLDDKDVLFVTANAERLAKRKDAPEIKNTDSSSTNL